MKRFLVLLLLRLLRVIGSFIAYAGEGRWRSSSEERRRILELHLESRRPGLGLPLATVVSRSDGFSGAELEQTVIEAMHLAFAEIRELTESDMILAASQLVPLSRTAREQMESLKQWASAGRARPASLRAVTNPDAA